MRQATARHPNAIPDDATCTAQLRSGRFCDAPGIEGAPFPICAKHAARLFLFMRSTMNNLPPEERMEVTIGALSDGRQARVERAPYAAASVVYYVRMGDLVKIGYTADLRARMSASYVAGDLLAAEPGDVRLEARRHREFAGDLARGKEWFRPSPALMAHIETVKRQQREGSRAKG